MARATSRPEAEVAAERDKLLEESRELTLDRVRLDVERRICQDRLADLKEVTLAVFANSRYKYHQRETVPVAVPGVPGWKDPYGCDHPEQPSHVEERERTKEVEGEG